jgi:hypothetical protein
MRYALCFQLTLVTPRRAPLLFKKETGKFSLLNGVSYKRRVIDKLRAENVRKMPVYQKNQDALWHNPTGTLRGNHISFSLNRFLEVTVIASEVRAWQSLFSMRLLRSSLDMTS